ncbi:hypothetical protein FA95DRAFT_1451859, partial [Auriscalpium vulgare]
WLPPFLDFVYAQGEPRGMLSATKAVSVPVLQDRSGRMVPCRKSHSTCTHTNASREDLRARLEEDTDILRRETATPVRQVRERTLALYSAYLKLGCPAPRFEEASYDPDSQAAVDNLELENARAERRRGLEEPVARCQGKLFFEYDERDVPHVRCEHYNTRANRHHLVDYTVSRGSHDADYLEALFEKDFSAIDAIEADSEATDLSTDVGGCRTVANCSSQRVHCPRDHRQEGNGNVVAIEMVTLECSSRFQMYEPLPEHRSACPFVLVVCSGAHTHPIPLPTKTPPCIRREILTLLHSIGNDLAEITPRKLLRHTTVQAYLRQRLPNIETPTLSDVHVSLANRDHIKSYIRQAKADAFPFGTGWNGLENLIKQEDMAHRAVAQYIRYMDEVPLDSLAHWDPSQSSDGKSRDTLRIVVCMEREQSVRLHDAQYLQSDIAFRRVPDFYEFELGGWDRMNKTALVFCRIFLTSQSAATHFLAFQKLEEVVQRDTGRRLRWRHIHSASIHDRSGILHWAADQHGGQAKGLGLHLCAVARTVQDRRDFHEPEKLLSDLTPYEHLRRIFRLCSVHIYRNIKTCAVPDAVKHLMRSLVCIEHDSWDDTVHAIERDGGRPGSAWVQDKVRSRFAFPGMCWSKSHIPLDIWQAGDRNSNLIEAAHADVNREGTGCTLVSGVSHAHRFDSFKLKTLQAHEITGVRGTFHSGAPSELSLRNLRRQQTARFKALLAEDRGIETANTRLMDANTRFSQADQHKRRIDAADRAVKAADRARKELDKAAEASLGRIGKGTGKVPLLLP